MICRIVRHLVTILALAVSLLGAQPITASPEQSNGGRTVHVKEYTKKDGTKVKAHDRKAPAPKAPKAAKPVKVPSSKSSGKAGTQRSDAARHAFARQTGFPNGRPGYVIDHIVPLACGGADAPANMQWQSIAEAKAKDRVERIGCK
jgi:hypothetical protein